MLTQRGWLFADAARDAGFRVHRYGVVARALDQTIFATRVHVDRLAAGPDGRSSWRGRVAARVADIAAMCSTALAAFEVRTWSRRRGAPDLVVVLTYLMVPTIFAALRGDTRTFVYTFVVPLRRSGRVDRALQRLERVRGGLHIGLPDAELERAWAKRLPGVPRSIVRITGVDSSEVLADHVTRAAARRAARERLGIGAEERIALLFGAGHPEQDPDVVEQAFADGRLAEVGLVVAGLIVRLLERPEAARLAFAGFVSAAERDDLFAAADLVLLSFRDGFSRDSATLMDAVARGLPVVVSGGASAADVVARHGLGEVFVPGDVDSFVDAVLRAPAQLPVDVVAHAQAELTHAAVARRLLELAGLDESARPA